MINLLLALIPLFAILLVTGHPIRPALLFLPVAILLAALFTLGAGLLLSPLRQIDAGTPPELDLYLILDNYSSHQTAEVRFAS